MASITLTSDFGLDNHYVAVLKGIILTELGNVPIVDISHGGDVYNVPAVAHVLKSCAFEFPEGSIHLVSVGSHTVVDNEDGFVAAKIKGHFFIGPNNGILQLLADEFDEAVSLGSFKTTFPAKDILLPAIISLWRGVHLKDVGAPLESVSRMIARSINPVEGGIQGTVIFIDNYGNAITNISQKDFDKVGENGFEIRVGREKIRELSEAYSDRNGGDAIALFNEQGLLEIAVVTGPANELLGLKYDSPILVLSRG